MKVSVLSQTPQQLKLRFQLPTAVADPDAKLEAMRNAVRQVLTDKKLFPAREPRLTAVPGPGLMFNCELELFPKVTLPTSLSVSQEVPELHVPTEAQLLASVEALQIRLGESVPHPGPAAWGQLLSLDMAGFVRGEPIPFSFQSDLPVMLTQISPQAELMQGLLGMLPGETRILTMTLPADHPYLPWRGAEAQYHVLLNDCTELRVPPADDQLAQACGVGESFNDLLKVLHEQLAQEQRARWREQIREQVVAEIVNASSLTLPDNWVNDQLKATWQTSDGDRIAKLRLTLTPQLKTGLEQKSWASWQKMNWLKDDQAKSFKTRLVLREIGLREGLILDAQELLHPLQVAAVVSGQPEFLQDTLGKLYQDKLIDRYGEQVWLDKVVRWLLTQAQMTHQGQPLPLG